MPREIVTSEHADPPSKSTRLVINSATRKRDAYPTPARYIIDLDEPLIDVTSLVLVKADVPLAQFQVSPGCNEELAICVAPDGSTWESTERLLRIPPGDYEPPANLAAALQSALQDLLQDLPGTLTVDFVPYRDGFRLTSQKGALRLLCGSNGNYRARTIARLLGLGPKTHETTFDGVSHVLTSEFRRNTSFDRKIVMYIDGADTNISVDPLLNKSFAVVYPCARGISVFHDGDLSLPRKSYNPPVSKLGRVGVRFFNVYGEPYDFQNQDHVLEFLVTSAPRYQSRINWTTRPG